MAFLQRFARYIVPSVDPEISREIDRKSMRNIYIISVLVLIFESLTFIVFLSAKARSFGHYEWVSTLYVIYCLLLCGLAVFLSKKMFQNRKISQKKCVAVKVFFFVAFSLWAILTDFRHYTVHEQMLTFYTVNLVMACFIIFKPWTGMIFFGCAHLGMYLLCFSYDHAAGIQPLNFLVLCLASIACNAVHYHSHIHSSMKEHRLKESNKALENASHRDGLTGLKNRLALDEDAAAADGRHITAFMIDINYFKEINDRYGHAIGDQILRETSYNLKKLFPGASCYRYGGDEFLVLTHRPAQDNYGAPTYDFTNENSAAKVSLSIGSAQGNPAGRDELYALISLADKALYVIKKRTHSIEGGGHERRN